MFHFFKRHIFWIVFGTFFALYFLFLTIIFFAPRVDLKQRGFIPCTKALMENLYRCPNKRVSCALKEILKNNICDFNVIKTGFTSWLEEKQKTPWANYYFTPVTEEMEEAEPEDEELKAYYQKHLDMASEMEELNRNRIELEKQINSSKVQIPETPNTDKENNTEKEIQNEENK